SKLYFDNCRSMETTQALEAFQALSQETRLAVLRLLVQAGPNGLPAGLIADRLAVQPSTLSTHLAKLERAGLVASRRQSRHIFYAAQFEGLRRLIAFLMEDCCRGLPEICGGLVATEPGACAPKPKAKPAPARGLVSAHSINAKRK